MLKLYLKSITLANKVLVVGLWCSHVLPRNDSPEATAAVTPGSSVTHGDDNVRLHRLRRPAATRVTLRQGNDPGRRHHGHDLLGQRRGSDDALSPLSRDLRPHAVHAHRHLRRLCAEP